MEIRKLLKNNQLIVFLTIVAIILLGIKLILTSKESAVLDKPPLIPHPTEITDPRLPTLTLFPSPITETSTPQPPIPTPTVTFPADFTPTISLFPTIDPNASYLPSEEIIEGLQKEKELAEKNYPLWENLPYSEDEFYISHYVEPLTLVVHLRETTKENALPKINQWIRNQDVDPSTHQITWEEK